MKGFIKILESIIASIIILSSITFFLTFQRPSVEQQAQFNYVLAALDKNGTLDSAISNNDVEALNTSLKNMLPETVDFSVEISGIPNPVIRIACVCDASQRAELISRLNPLEFNYRSRKIKILVDIGDMQEMANSGADILFFFGYRTFTGSEQSALKKFLQNGTLFMLADLEQSQVEDGVMDELFGLKWGATDSTNGKFVDTDNPGNVSYKISRYYRSLGGVKDPTFTPRIPPLPPAPPKNRIAVDGRTIVGFPPALSTTSLVKINEVGSRGRTAWFIGYNPTLPPGNPNAEMNMLLKATVLWASGENYKMDPQFKIVPAVQTFRQYSYVGLLDEFEPFLISLKIWSVFF